MEIKELLEISYKKYNHPSFIALDPISIPHGFELKEDIEISGFLAATIAWGQRTTIVKNASEIMKLMSHQPYRFVIECTEKDLKVFEGFVHRTFNTVDLCTFIFALKNIYQQYGGMEKVFAEGFTKGGMNYAIAHFRDVFFRMPHQKRTRKHVSDPLSGSSAKRINMFLRWMVRKDDMGVDLGIWQSFRANQLICPLDTHSGRVARKLGLLSRKQNDWKAAEELTQNLRILDKSDPVKYDFALFGLGVFEKF